MDPIVSQAYPLVIEVSELHSIVQSADKSKLRIIEICSTERFLDKHVPGSLHATPADTQSQSGILGFAPEPERLQALVNRLGIDQDTHCIVYDDEGGGWAGRFIWLLDEMGHSSYSYVNGGFTAWQAAGHECESGPSPAFESGQEATLSGQYTVSKDALLNELGSSELVVWDARSAGEYTGEKANAKRAGRIPGAVNFDWLDIMDKANALRFRNLDVLRQELSALGITPDKKIVTHCQTHHRSGLSYLVAKVMRFEKIYAYAGSWGEWGNDPSTPIETSL